MGKPLIIDVDGVLADFTGPFTTLLNVLDPAYAKQTTQLQLAWDFGQGDAVDRAWQIVNDPDSKFWDELEPLPGVTSGAVNLLHRWSRLKDRPLVVCTCRKFPKALRRTENWLLRTFDWAPTVLTVPNKSSKQFIAFGLGAAAAIDDCPKILADYQKIGVIPHAPRYPYNDDIAGVTYHDLGFVGFVEAAVEGLL